MFENSGTERKSGPESRTATEACSLLLLPLQRAHGFAQSGEESTLKHGENERKVHHKEREVHHNITTFFFFSNFKQHFKSPLPLGVGGE